MSVHVLIGWLKFLIFYPSVHVWVLYVPLDSMGNGDYDPIVIGMTIGSKPCHLGLDHANWVVDATHFLAGNQLYDL